MQRLSVFATLLLVACPAPMQVTCGAGTQLEGETCVVSPPAGTDGGVAVELPVTAIIRPSPIRVMQGFASCPSITLAWADGRSRLLILDPEYAVLVSDSVHLESTGLSLRWVSSAGLVSTAQLPHCSAALVGETPGAGPVSLEVTGPDGSKRIVGTATVEVLALPSAGLSLTEVGLENGSLVLYPTHGRPPDVAGGPRALPVGETKALVVGLDVMGTEFVDVDFLLVEQNLTVTIGDPSIAELLSGRRVKGLRDGTTSLTATYAVAGKTLGTTQAQLWVSDSRQTIGLGFTLPITDDGFVLPDANRYANTVVVGQCFNFSGVATTSGLQPRAAAPTWFDRDVTSTGTWTARGQGLTQTTARPARFCATSEGEAAVRLCEGGLCANLGVLVVSPPLAFPTLQVTIPNEIHAGTFEFTTACVDFQVTAQFASGPRDVTQSVALRFAESFGSGPSPLFVDYTAEGVPRFEQGKLCLSLQPFTPSSSFRVFWGTAQVEVNTTVKF